MQRSSLITLVIVLAAAIGVTIGIGSYTFVYAQGASYLTTDPRSCANCHVMNEQYAGWVKSSHRHAATCADCHMPHDFVGKWTAKAISGFNHSLAFTTGNFPEPIRIGERNRKITEQTCRSCHAPIVAAIDTHAGGAAKKRSGEDEEPLSCVRCHLSVGHLH